MKKFIGTFAALAMLAGGMQAARAVTVFSENFDAGSATFTANDPYWLTNTDANGYVIQTTNSGSVYGGLFSTEITNDVSGRGYFLFEGTASYPSSNSFIPAGADQFYISPTFAVAANSNYTVSFYATAANAFATLPSLQPELGGSLLGSPITPLVYGGSGWQLFSYTWNSGANTTASLILHDFQTSPNGNDFGVDEILVTGPGVVPLPSGASAGLVGMLLVAIYGWRRNQLV